METVYSDTHYIFQPFYCLEVEILSAMNLSDAIVKFRAFSVFVVGFSI
jgi:hypothetical protein